jgi:hypothetical protein
VNPASVIVMHKAQQSFDLNPLGVLELVKRRNNFSLHEQSV